MKRPPFLTAVALVDQVPQMECTELPATPPQLAPRAMPRLLLPLPIRPLSAAQICRMPLWRVRQKLGRE